MKPSLKWVAVAGLVLGGALGMAGSFAAQANVRNILWAIDSVGLVVATVILAMHFYRKGREAVAAGFLVFALGESVMLVGTAGTLEASVPAFAAGTALWAAGLLMVSLPGEFPLWTRLAGLVTGVLMAITAVSIFWGRAVTPLSRPLPLFAYPVLVLTFVGWLVRVIREE
ncbi:MAG TPA: hypothetical protein VFU55_01010 [Terracidiphilus sp.]|nr:hypothetical protein [Terracidiphilus sp.]